MIAVVSRVSSARLSVGGSEISSIGKGLLIYVCAEKGDGIPDAEKLAHKCAGLRIFEDGNGKMNLNPAAAGGEFLVVSNFTLAGELGSGFRPSFTRSEEPESAKSLLAVFVSRLREAGRRVSEGVFGADMKIENTADGPVTLILAVRNGKLTESA
ncbi:MAG: D-tyrosyl-tRNA(Tyr) deacylase [Clostridia bacterium]|nr:D-tyrosyl-tRNA(Tyr) deacylase [Clostridia bacterium]